MNIKETLREKIPNIKAIRKMMSKYRVREIDSWMLDDMTIAEGEQNQAKRSETVRKHIDEPRIKAIRRQAEDILSTKTLYNNISNRDAIKEDMLFCSMAYGFKPVEYYVFKLDKKTPDERKQYVSDLIRTRYHCLLNDLADASIFKNKYTTYLKYKEYYKREAIFIESRKDFSIFEEFIKKHPVFVKKKVYESLGRSVELIDSKGKDINNVFQTILAGGKTIIEECIRQSATMSAINPSSVNTVRYVTINTRDGVEVPVCFLRIGQGGSFVDNAGAGGIAACIDKETGVIFTDGYDENGNIYECHPDTGTVFKNYQLPDWKSLRKICSEIAVKIPTIKYVGWDMAHTDHGWVIVEGNAGSQIIAQQMILGGLKKTMDDLVSRTETTV